jgi:hypothetical protein
MTENRDKLLPQLGRLTLIQERRFTLCQLIDCIQMAANKLGKQIEGFNRFRVVEPCRAWIDCAERAEEPPVCQNNGNGNIALKAILRRCVMPAKRLIFGNMIDDNGPVALSNLVADCRLDLQFAAWFKAKIYFVANRTAYSALLGDTRDRSETHSGCAANHIENSWHSIDALDRINVRLKYAFHCLKTPKGSRVPRPDKRSYKAAGV